VDPASGRPLSATNTIPYRNTTAVIGELVDGASYKFVVQSLSVAYDDGASSSLTFMLPDAGRAVLPAGAPRAVQGLGAAPRGPGGARVTWQPPAGGPRPDDYLVQVHHEFWYPLHFLFGTI
jgi:hypothetical protein